MKYLVSCFLLLAHLVDAQSQSRAIDSLNNLISKAKSDTQKINLQIAKLSALSNQNLDSAIALGSIILVEAKKINYKKGEATIRLKMAGDYCFTGDYKAAESNLNNAKLFILGTKDSSLLSELYDRYGMMYGMQNKYDTSHSFYRKAIEIAQGRNDNSSLISVLQNNAIAYQQESNYPQALTNYQQALSAAEKIHDEVNEAYIYLNIAITYSSLDDNNKAEQYYLKAIDLANKLALKNVLAYTYANLSTLYEQRKTYNKQFEMAMKAAVLGKEIADKGITASSLSRAAAALANENKFQEAERLNWQAIGVADSSKQPYNIHQAYGNMGFIYKLQKRYTEAIPFFEKSFQHIAESDIYDEETGNLYAELSECYEQTGDFKKALSTYKTAAKIIDSIHGRENIKKATELNMNYEFDKKQELTKAIQEKEATTNKIKQIFLLAFLLVFITLSTVALFAFRREKKAKAIISLQKERTESTLAELKTTQAQLIQSEKMASLGELTAGIAHEIQNPLNFVNNFSEVSAELVDEMEEALAKDDKEETLAIAGDVKGNLKKINLHGKRADAIVKGMLQHSRASAGKKEPTDINALAEEYLRLSYHGVRAKDKLFSADLDTNFDQGIGKAEMVPQDIGRVLLNLYNNAFYAVGEKKKTAASEGTDYKPTVWVNTKRISTSSDERLEISVRDNGSGVPQKVADKIFQPFFTTKPTGQGTGLGLSLSYDIIKAHGGDIKLETKEGEGAEFTINLPVA